jgi:hypothetical protein
MAWKRLDYDKLEDNTVGGHDSSPFLRVYGEDGKEWPRLIIDINDYSFRKADHFQVTCSRKDDLESWWGDSEIPLELAGDVIEILGLYVADHGKKEE